MKYIILAGISWMFISSLHAQSNRSKDSAFSMYLNNQYFFNHTNRLQQNNNPSIQFQKDIKPIDPFVLQLEQPKLVFLENVNHFNIYQSSPDNMYIQKPDSSVLFNMPVAINN